VNGHQLFAFTRPYEERATLPRSERWPSAHALGD
jgi:hypothetical protein